MRNTFVAGLALLACAVADGAEPPIPQDAARMEQRSRERLEWNRKTLVGNYEKVGKKDPKWDESARRAFDLAARMFSRPFEPLVTLGDIHVPAKKAVDDGCDDPMVLYLYARSSVGPLAPDKAEHSRRLQKAADALTASTYSPFRRAMAIEVMAGFTFNEHGREERADLERRLDAELDLVPASAKEDPRGYDWEDLWFQSVTANMETRYALSGDFKAAYEAVDAKLAKVEGIDILRLMVRGYYHLMSGWRARGNALASRVGEDQFRTFDERLAAARSTFEEVYKLNPDEPRMARLMLEVERGIGRGDRESMEKWFERAMKTDGNDREACRLKLEWLMPKWHGDDEQVMAFGKACAATRNWQAGITVLAAEAHFVHCMTLELPEWPKYLGSPEVWGEISSIYDEYLKSHPVSPPERSKYALICYLTKHYPEAHAQFQILGDGLAEWQTDPRYPLETLKAVRQKVAGIIANGPR